jgi:hypothetical protein
MKGSKHKTRIWISRQNEINLNKVICHFLDNLPNKIECEHNGGGKLWIW